MRFAKSRLSLAEPADSITSPTLDPSPAASVGVVERTGQQAVISANMEHAEHAIDRLDSE